MHYSIYTDGSCLSNPGGKGGIAFCIINNITGEEIFDSLGYYSTTNNRMEMMAILKAIKRCPIGKSIMVYSDSQYAINCFSVWLKSWKKSNFKNRTVKNYDLIFEYLSLMDYYQIQFSYVRGHNGNVFNDKCDKYAQNIAIEGPWLHDEEYEKNR